MRGGTSSSKLKAVPRDWICSHMDPGDVNSQKYPWWNWEAPAGNIRMHSCQSVSGRKGKARSIIIRELRETLHCFLSSLLSLPPHAGVLWAPFRLERNIPVEQGGSSPASAPGKPRPSHQWLWRGKQCQSGCEWVFCHVCVVIMGAL